MKYIESRHNFLNLLIGTGKDTISKTEINDLCEQNKINVPQWFVNDKNNRIGRGMYKVPTINNVQAKIMQIQQHTNTHNRINKVTTELDNIDLIPKPYENYVPFGNFDDVLCIVKANKFFPVFISGHSGNGKTMSIEQACAKAKRKFICVSMTPETDESDLLGNYVLIDGEMVWRDGPVTTAARQGAVLCIDEIDYGAQNLSSLQRVLEGKPFLLKKKGEVVVPLEGFTVFATANTKGKGSDDGRYMFTNVLNEAFLERFRNTFEQEWAPVATEKKILKKELKSVNKEDDEFADKLVMWADVIRKTFDEGGCDEVISTRRLVHIVETYGIFGDKMKSINLCLNRFDEDTKASFLDLYTKIDSSSDQTQMEMKISTASEKEEQF